MWHKKNLLDQWTPKVQPGSCKLCQPKGLGKGQAAFPESSLVLEVQLSLPVLLEEP